jgi:Polysaccharide lyase
MPQFVLPRRSLLAGALACLMLLCGAFPAADASAKKRGLAITSPAKVVKVKGKLKVTIRASRAFKKVRFGVDGRRLWVDHSRPFKFRKTGYLNTRRLKRGKHRLWVSGRRKGGKLKRVSRVFYVQRKRRRAPRRPGGPAPTPAPAPPLAPFGGNVIFRGDFDTGDASQFEDVESVPGRVTVGTSGPAPFQGSHRGRFEVQAGDEFANGNRTEVRGPDFSEGDERWIRQAIYVPTGTATESGWRLVAQFGSGNGSPPVALFLESDSNLSFQVGYGDSSTFDWEGPAIQRNRWYDIVLHVRFSSNPTVGFVEVYLNGQRQTMTNGQPRRYRATLAGDGVYYKTGIYRSDSIGQTDVVYHDNVLIAAP